MEQGGTGARRAANAFIQVVQLSWTHRPVIGSVSSASRAGRLPNVTGIPLSVADGAGSGTDAAPRQAPPCYHQFGTIRKFFQRIGPSLSFLRRMPSSDRVTEPRPSS